MGVDGPCPCEVAYRAGGHWATCNIYDPTSAQDCNCPAKHGIPREPPLSAGFGAIAGPARVAPVFVDGDFGAFVVEPPAEEPAPFPPMPDYVNNPPHYTKGEIECIDAIKAALTPEEFAGFCKGNALKYVWRERHKGGPESLAKAVWYLDRAAGKPRA
jgi:hypothetical protein